MMKKIYLKPTCKAYVMSVPQLMAGSGGIEQGGTPGGGNHGGSSGNGLDLDFSSGE
ncbi:MAG: hypothetical protein IJV10_04930 [Prevotella sp.]|nr:hypothetical protein [Prevotella sp.]